MKVSWPGDSSSLNREFLTWCSAALLTDHQAADLRDNAERPWLWVPAVHTVFGLSIEALPEPVISSQDRGGRDEVTDRHRTQFDKEFQRFIYGLFVESYFRRDDIYRNEGYFTFDLRIMNDVGHKSSQGSLSHLRIALLARLSVPVGGDDPEDPAAPCWMQLQTLADAAKRRLMALIPRDLMLRQIQWRDPTEPNIGDQLTVPAELALGSEAFAATLDLRRETMFSELTLPLRLDEFGRRLQHEAVEGSRLYAMPASWPDANPDLLRTCAVLSSLTRRAVLSCRLVPTLKTASEIATLRQRLSWLCDEQCRLARDPVSSVKILDQHLEGFQEILRHRELFYAVIQIAADHMSDAHAIASSLQAEFQAARETRNLGNSRGIGTGRLAIVSAENDAERATSSYNLGFLEVAPWGAASLKAVKAQQPSQSSPDAVPTPSFVSLDQVLARRPELFLQRDIEIDSSLARMRGLVTLSEACHLWRLPIVPPGGQAGLVSRYSNPFEKLSEATPADGDAVSMGIIQHRGQATGQDFRLAFIDPPHRTQSLAPIGDRVMVVAGSPGSGKTNFALHFLSQIYKDSSDAGLDRRNHPYLVIDPTRGEEFRALADPAGQDFVLFTVGDESGFPFHFNPFRVPRSVSVQAHISRLMACFKAAYHMWDPLPQIFERAIRRAYRVVRKSLWQERHGNEVWSAARDVPLSDLEPCPNLGDVIGAMGNGENTVWALDNEPTVLQEQREMWGGQTENAATVVASTFLRLDNLNENYGHILGGHEDTGSAVDIRKLLSKPTVMELGTVGDSQALSLIIGFLLTVVAGTIETMKQERTAGHIVHMIVLEEAHRLLSAEIGGGGESGNSQRQAAEDINNLLAEVRKYRQGVILMDQRPGSLVGGAIDNAYVVCMHRLNEEKSFNQFAKILNMNEDQQRFARTELRPGEMILLDRRSGAPVLVRAPNLNTAGDSLTVEALAPVVEANLAKMRLPSSVGARSAMALQPISPASEVRLEAVADASYLHLVSEAAGEERWHTWLKAGQALRLPLGLEDQKIGRELIARLKAWIRLTAATLPISNRPFEFEPMLVSSLRNAGHDPTSAVSLARELAAL